MILIDTSAWVEYLRDTNSAACVLVDELLDAEMAICGVVRMELLAGARDEAQLQSLRDTLSRAILLPMYQTDYDEAAALYRTCRRQGATIRNLTDCLVAAVAIRTGAPVLHSDRDFDALARHTALQVYDAGQPR